jgi:tetrahydromethanopterin S-methyltransferase subunit B
LHSASHFEHILLRESRAKDEAMARLDHLVVRLYNSTYPKRQVFSGWPGFSETTAAGAVLARNLLIGKQGIQHADRKL